MKNSTLKFILLVSVVLNLTILSTIGYLYYKRTTYWTSPFGHTIQKDRFLFEELSLKPEQLRMMKEKAIPFRAGIDEKRKEIAQKKKELLILMRADLPDKKAIDNAITGISRMQEELQRDIARHMLELKASLDSEQQKKFLDLIENAMKEGRQMGCQSSEHN